MNKKFIALVSSVAFALAPATTVLAEGESTDQGYNPSAQNQSQVETTTDETGSGYYSSSENHSYVTPEFSVYHTASVSSNTDVKTGNKKITYVTQYSVGDSFFKKLIKKFKLDSKKVVDAFEIDEGSLKKNEAYSITFTNKAVYKDGHVYKVHHFYYDDDELGYVEKEAPTATAKNGSITVTLHGASPVVIEDLGVAKTAETKVSKNGRKAALKTGVEY